MNNNTLYLFVGKSASGKTSIADLLGKRYGMKQVYSFTTRPPRYDGEIGHVFVTEEIFKHLGELAAYTFYQGQHYGTTFQQLDECSIYVIDVPGVKSLLNKLNDKESKRPIRIIYFDTAVSTRIMRMVNRGASDHEILSRLLIDDTTDDWYRNLNSVVWHYKNIEQKDIELDKIDANRDIENVLEQVLSCMNKKR